MKKIDWKEMCRLGHVVKVNSELLHSVEAVSDLPCIGIEKEVECKGPPNGSVDDAEYWFVTYVQRPGEEEVYEIGSIFDTLAKCLCFERTYSRENYYISAVLKNRIAQEDNPWNLTIPTEVLASRITWYHIPEKPNDFFKTLLQKEGLR